MVKKIRAVLRFQIEDAALLCVFALVFSISILAAATPSARQGLSTVIVGLGAAGLILFREYRKMAKSLGASEARSVYLATHDDLTKLPNRTLLLNRIESVVQGAQNPVFLFCVGLDRFHEIGEVLGPAASDEVIKAVAERLAAAAQGGETVGRLGDEDFAIVWTGLTQSRAEAFAGEIIRLVSAPFEAALGTAYVTCSIGFSRLCAAADPVETLRRSKLALAQARRLGGGKFKAYDPALDRAFQGRKALESDLRLALTTRQMTMAYQPQVNATGVVFGVEALMRWSGARGPVSPGVFIPLAERCGLADEVGRFALQQAFKDAHRWPGLKVAVNISAAQIRAGDLIHTLQGLLSESRIHSNRIELEITEGVLLDEDGDTLATLATLRRMGFSLALDDFGTGYSSLSYLRRFALDKIKIDQSFVAQLGLRPESDAIVKAIVDLARALELKVIAEGVETRAQVDRLAVAGCHDVQGFFFSPPVSADEIDRLFTGARELAA